MGIDVFRERSNSDGPTRLLDFSRAFWIINGYASLATEYRPEVRDN